MIKTIVFPGRYVQGPGALNEAGKFIQPLGKKVLVVWDSFVSSLISERLKAGFDAAGLELYSFVFSGECSKNQRDIGIQKAREIGVDVVVGAGGGKAVDLAKGIAFNVNARMVSFPTVSSNDAPTSACSVYYTDGGVIDGFDIWQRNPDLVLVDSEIVAGAPARWLAAGIGDALATWFEANAANKACRSAFAGGYPTISAMSLARLCYETLMEYGLSAMMDAENKIVTPALEKVIEANTLLSGIGWESGGLATAHTIGNNITILECTHPYLHGEKVAFGLVTQLCLDPDTDLLEKQEVVDFMIRVGLPVTFAEIGMGEVTQEELLETAKTLTEEGNFVHNHVFPVSANDFYWAMIKADAYGKSRKAALDPETQLTKEAIL